MTPLCLNPRCRVLGQHTPTCTDPDCRGCLPHRAADGLRLCERCIARLAADANLAAHLHTELEHVLAAPERPGERTSGSPDRARLPNPAAVECRTEIRHVLASWSRLIAEDRGHRLPADTVPAMGAYVARNAVWLAAQDYAGDACTELADLAHGRAWRVAYPNGTRSFDVAGCPMDGCGGTIRAVLRQTDSLLPSALICSTDETHCWAASEWITLGRKLRQAQEEAA